ncbi:MAG: flagellar motor protein MotB, partial [Cucumibacter sp.]
MEAVAQVQVSPEDAAKLAAAGLPAEILIALEELNQARAAARQTPTPEALENERLAEAAALALCQAAGFPDLLECQRAVAEALAFVPQDAPPPPPAEVIPEAALEQSIVEALPESVPPEEAAPVLDSQKEDTQPPVEGQTQPEPEAQAAPPPDAVPPPQTDAEAQAAAVPAEIQSANAEEGQPIDREEGRRRDRPDDANVVQEFNFSIVIEFNNNLFIRGNDEARYTHPQDQTFYESLSGGRTREIIQRPDGSYLITIYSRNGDVLRRSKILPDGREIVLVYVEEQYWEDMDQWRDPGDALPPLYLNIPVREYVYNVNPYETDEDLVDFWSQPPVQSVDRLYSIDEIRRSARIRDLARRVEVDDLNFAFGSAQISQSEIRKLAAVANAMLALLDRNPADTFLVEGHADAPGSIVLNLQLSQARDDGVVHTARDCGTIFMSGGDQLRLTHV